MRQFRKIMVDGAEYRWLFRYDDYDYCFPSYLLFLAELLKFCLRQRVDFSGKQNGEFDGDAALRKLGYGTSLGNQ